MLFNMVVKLKPRFVNHFFCFRPMLFNMVAKRTDQLETNCGSFRPMLFNMVVKVILFSIFTCNLYRY